MHHYYNNSHDGNLAADFPCWGMSFPALCLLISLFLMSACIPQHQGQSTSPQGPSRLPHPESKIQIPAQFSVSSLPATYKGNLECPDCEGIRVHLNIRPDGTFEIKRVWRSGGRDGNPVIDHGTWNLSPDKSTITLTINNRIMGSFKMVSEACMVPADLAQAPTPETEWSLCRAESLEPIQKTVQMRGLYSYMADLGMFRDCDTGERYPVATEKDNMALEQAYLNTEHGIAEPLVARFEGHVTTRPAMEGSRMDKVVVVDRFIEMTSARSCKAPVSAPSASEPGTTLETAHTNGIENRKWELIELAGAPLDLHDGMTPPGFRLNPEGKNLRGFGGCNRMMGSYMLDGDRLIFSGIATTRKFCVDTQGIEDRFVQALGQVRRYSIEGNILTLYGDYGELAKLRWANTQ